MTTDKRWDALSGSWKPVTLAPVVNWMEERESNRFYFKDYAERGPVGRKTDINSVDEYERMFGSIKDHLQVRMALANGCAVSFERMILPTAQKARITYVLLEGCRWDWVADNEGSWGNSIELHFSWEKCPAEPVFNLVIKYPPQFTIEEHFYDLNFSDENSPRYFMQYINNRSRLVRVKKLSFFRSEPIVAAYRRLHLSGGSD